MALYHWEPPCIPAPVLERCFSQAAGGSVRGRLFFLPPERCRRGGFNGLMLIMAKLERLNSFFIERLMAVAGEIFEAVKDTVSAYQEEVERTKQENHRLKEILTEITVSISRHAQTADLLPPCADRQTPVQNSNQRPLESDPSVLQLNPGFATIEQGGDPQLLVNSVSASSSACAHGDPTSQAVPQELPSINQEPLYAEPSFIQVKEELSGMHLNAESHKPLNNPLSPSSSPSAATAYSEEPPDHISGTTVKEEIGGEGPHNAGATIKLEPWDSQSFCPDNVAVAQTENLPENHVEGLRDDHGSYPSYQCPVQPDPVSQSRTAEGLFCCRFCGKPFKSRGQLKQHLVVHQKERPYRCDLCGKCYSYAQVLEIHYRTHTGERPYHCRFCGRCFRQRSHLNDHERIHTGEKPYSCSVCGKRFVQSSQVKKHIRNLHQQSV
ncbi:uncharacterized protein [Salminus brasiliensis]|uniref:uncharacterized protein n=1 Tax=Salminus brasiliensis TaxID=930266 RepID=UPI003B8345B3